MKTRRLRAALWLVAILPGLCTVLTCGYYIVPDWAALRRAFAPWEKTAHSGGDLRAVTVAESYQNVFRTNVFAEGVWLLLGAILCAIGILGLCVINRDYRNHESKA